MFSHAWHLPSVSAILYLPALLGGFTLATGIGYIFFQAGHLSLVSAIYIFRRFSLA